jgi:hypothetical protein
METGQSTGQRTEFKQHFCSIHRKVMSGRRMVSIQTAAMLAPAEFCAPVPTQY